MLKWLPDTSPFAASIAGGREWLGWGLDRLLARRLDWHTAAAVSKETPRPIPMPKEQAAGPARVVRLRDLPKED